MKFESKPKYRGRQADPVARAKRKESIIQAAHHVLRKKGFHRASTVDISRFAGISVAGIYHYFASKNALVSTLIERELQLRLELAENFSQFDDFFEGLDYLFINLARNHENILCPCLRMDILSLASRSEIIATQLGQLHKSTIDRGELAIVKAQERGQIESSLDPVYAAKMLVAATDGLMVNLCLSGQMSGNSRLAVMDFVRRVFSP